MGKIRRREFLVAGMSLAATPLLRSTAWAQQKTIKIGALYPLTGNLASTGLDCRRGVELAVDIINGKYDLNLPLAKTEGLPNLGGAKIELVWADTKGEPKNGQAEAERLVTQDKVVACIGAYQSAVTKTASQATERLKIPYVCSDSSSPTLTERDFKYFFRVSPHDGSFAKDQFSFLKDLEKTKKQKVETVALLYENTEFGANVGKEELKYAQEFGYKVVADISYAANATDVTSEVGRLIKANPDVLMHASYITDAILFTKTFKEMGFNPKGFVTMAGYIEPGYLPAVKADGNFMIIRSTFALDLAKKKPLVGQVNELYKKKFNLDLGENASRSFTAPFIIADAINRAKTTDAETVVKALRETNIPGDQVLYPWKGVQFDPKTQQNIYAIGTLVQIQDQAYHTVWPFESAAKDLVWPFPSWKSRK
ncbi:MAG TPA: ABC transporter substrate-binding protein [Candidatus Baltobacteraceae bacterium]|nr:ABC transporter substrate-binding protein [Candidatus Baltobacteraceae bacterium]